MTYVKGTNRSRSKLQRRTKYGLCVSSFKNSVSFSNELLFFETADMIIPGVSDTRLGLVSDDVLLVAGEEGAVVQVERVILEAVGGAAVAGRRGLVVDLDGEGHAVVVTPGVRGSAL